MVVLYDGELPVHYGFGSVAHADQETPDMDEALSGQSNGLLGAGVSGALWMTFGLHTGPEPLRIEWFDSEPPVGEQWEEVVEASIDIVSHDLLLSAFEDFIPLAAPAVGPHRARFSAYGMDAARDLDSRSEGEAAPDRYQLQLWPAPAAPDRVVRQTSQLADYWHRTARDEPADVSPEQAEQKELARAYNAATVPHRQAALILLVKNVIAATDLGDEPAAARLAERIRRGDLLLGRDPGDELTELVGRLHAQSPPVRNGQVDVHHPDWRRMQASMVLESALRPDTAEAMTNEYGPLYHAKWALDEMWPSTAVALRQALSGHHTTS